MYIPTGRLCDRQLSFLVSKDTFTCFFYTDSMKCVSDGETLAKKKTTSDRHIIFTTNLSNDTDLKDWHPDIGQETNSGAKTIRKPIMWNSPNVSKRTACAKKRLCDVK